MLNSKLYSLGICLLLSACATNSLKAPISQTGRVPAGREQYDDIALNYNKPVLLIVAEMTSSNEHREKEISDLISRAHPQIQFCYEKASAIAPADAFNIFYFSVYSNGQFGEISSESDKVTSANKNFHVCVMRLLGSLRADSWVQKLSFRLKLPTETK